MTQVNRIELHSNPQVQPVSLKKVNGEEQQTKQESKDSVSFGAGKGSLIPKGLEKAGKMVAKEVANPFKTSGSKIIEEALEDEIYRQFTIEGMLEDSIQKLKIQREETNIGKRPLICKGMEILVSADLKRVKDAEDVAREHAQTDIHETAREASNAFALAFQDPSIKADTIEMALNKGLHPTATDEEISAANKLTEDSLPEDFHVELGENFDNLFAQMSQEA